MEAGGGAQTWLLGWLQAREIAWPCSRPLPRFYLTAMENNFLHNYKIQSGLKPGINAIACHLCSLPPSDLHPRTLTATDVCLPHAGHGGHLLTGWLSHDPHGRRGPVPHHHQPPHQRCHSGTVALTLLQLGMYQEISAL